jgi:hypothetical protein
LGEGPTGEPPPQEVRRERRDAEKRSRRFIIQSQD